jgi:AcrR family transcriptional regulator
MSETAPVYALRSARPSARERLLAAADELFYEEGLNLVGIDRVIERAGVAKASLYNIFGSKDELIRAYLEAKHAARRERLERHLLKYATPRAQILGIFDLQSEVVSEPGFRGCAFVRANAELKPGSPVKQVCDLTRAWLRGVFAELARQAGAERPEELAKQLALLYDGAAVGAQMDGESSATRRARALAEALLDTVSKPHG